MNSLTTSFLISATTFGLISCSPKFYTPNTQNVPLISAHGETVVSLSGNSDQIELQGAYGVSNKLAIQANGGLFIPSDLENGNGGSGKFLEIGGGYFSSLQEQFVFETYALLGAGTFENHLPSTRMENPQSTGEITASLIRIGVQPAIGYKSTNFSAAVSTRMVNVTYNNIEGDLIFESIDQVNFLQNNSSNFLLEPALTLRGGVSKFKLQFQYGLSINLSNSDFRQDHSNISFGLNFTF